jgi:hypothetical protein
MLMERLTAEDQLMLWPDEIWPQDIGALAVLDGSSLLDTNGRFRIEAVREVVAGRLHLVPRFRQLLYVPPTPVNVQRKARSRPSLGVMPHRGIAGRTFLKIVDRQRVNLTSADIPGPQVPQYFAGARLVEVFPMAPLIGKVSLALAAMSYAGQFNITVIADRDTYLDLDVFVAGVQEELQALAAAMSAEPRPAPGFP